MTVELTGQCTAPAMVERGVLVPGVVGHDSAGPDGEDEDIQEEPYQGPAGHVVP